MLSGRATSYPHIGFELGRGRSLVLRLAFLQLRFEAGGGVLGGTQLVMQVVALIKEAFQVPVLFFQPFRELAELSDEFGISGCLGFSVSPRWNTLGQGDICRRGLRLL